MSFTAIIFSDEGYVDHPYYTTFCYDVWSIIHGYMIDRTLMNIVLKELKTNYPINIVQSIHKSYKHNYPTCNFTLTKGINKGMTCTGFCSWNSLNYCWAHKPNNLKINWTEYTKEKIVRKFNGKKYTTTKWIPPLPRSIFLRGNDLMLVV